MCYYGVNDVAMVWQWYSNSVTVIMVVVLAREYRGHS
jgi:hypothetical protein